MGDQTKSCGKQKEMVLFHLLLLAYFLDFFRYLSVRKRICNLSFVHITKSRYFSPLIACAFILNTKIITQTLQFADKLIGFLFCFPLLSFHKVSYDPHTASITDIINAGWKILDRKKPTTIKNIAPNRIVPNPL